MFASWKRRTLRARFTPLINNELPAPAAAELRERIAADPVLAAEFDQVTATVGSLHGLAAVAPPPDFRRDLDIERALAAEPLRERFVELTNQDLPAAEADALRRQIAAVPGLAAELAWVETAVAAARELPVAPVPPQFAAQVRRRVAAEAAPVTRRDPLAVPRFAWGLAALFVVGIGIAGFLAHQSSPGAVAPQRVAVAPPAVAPAPAPEAPAVAPEPEQPEVEPAEPTAAEAPEPAPESPPPPAPEPVRIASAPAPERVVRRSVTRQPRAAEPTRRVATRATAGSSSARPRISGPIARPDHSASGVRVARTARDTVLSPAAAPGPGRNAMTVASVRAQPAAPKRSPQPAASTLALRGGEIRLARSPVAASWSPREIPDPMVLNSARPTSIRFDGPGSRPEAPSSSRPRTVDDDPPDHVFDVGPRFDFE